MSDGQGSSAQSQRRFWRKIFSLENLAGDFRSAMIGSATGSIIGIASAVIASCLFARVTLQYTVVVNEDGYGQPKGLFNSAESKDPKLKLSFKPEELRSVDVCEYKLVTGESWKQVVLAYLDAYRECFIVTEREESTFIISPNPRGSLLEKRDNYYLCKCAASL